MKAIATSLFFFFVASFLHAQNKEKTYVLIHGAWHNAHSWDKVVPLMQEQGFRVMAIDLPGHGTDTTPPETVTLRTYVNKVKSLVATIDGQVILVGHSMAGIVISQAAEELGTKKVYKLIYLDAFLPKNGESVSSLARMIEATMPPDSTRLSIGKGLIISKNGTTSTFKPEVADLLFYHDCSIADKEFAHKHLTEQPFAPLGTPVVVTDSVYGSIPKYYILCTESKDLDKSVLPTRVRCERIIKMKTSHSPFFSKPKQLAKILMKM